MVVGALASTRLTPRTEVVGLLGGLALIMVGTLGWVLAPSWTWVVVATGVAGVGNGLAMAADGAIFARRTPDEARGRASAVYEGTGAVCSFGGYLLGGLALGLVPPQTFFVLTALGALAACLLVVRLLRLPMVEEGCVAPRHETTLSDPVAA